MDAVDLPDGGRRRGRGRSGNSMCHMIFRMLTNNRQTLFYKEERGKPRQIISAPLTRGTALLHRWVIQFAYHRIVFYHLMLLTSSHGPECMLHEGSTVEKGTKYVLRSDIMFMQ